MRFSQIGAFVDIILRGAVSGWVLGLGGQGVFLQDDLSCQHTSLIEVQSLRSSRSQGVIKSIPIVRNIILIFTLMRNSYYFVTFHETHNNFQFSVTSILLLSP